MRSFASDNNSGVHPSVLQAIAEANQNHAVGYGDDEWTRKAQQEFKQVFGEQAEVFFVFNGTGANSVALQLLVKPYNTIICAETAHIFCDECGAPARFTGAQVRPVATPDGKLTPEQIRPYLYGFGEVHHSQPKAIYITQSTELGTVYTIEELKAITALAHQYNMYVHMDGARLANAAEYLRVSMKALTTDCGIDVLSFGGTKNGLLMGESVVVLNPELGAEAPFIRKQSAQLASKLRYLSCQFSAYFANDLWLHNARHANQMAHKLADALRPFSEIHFTQKVEVNALFVVMPRPWIDALLQEYFFYFWDEASNEVRFVTSFDTTEDDIHCFVLSLQRIASQYPSITQSK